MRAPAAWAAQPVQNPQKPPDRSSPKSTLNSFISTLDRAYRIAGESVWRADIVILGSEVGP
jgi:hypothetical protein